MHQPRWVQAAMGAASAVVLAGLMVSGVTANVTSASAAAPKHFTIALSLGYVSNDWQEEAKNLIWATSKVPPYNHLVTLKTYIAGQSVENQISQLQDEISAGVNAIVLYPLSPTALNPTINAACQRGIKVFTYDATVTAPCAYQYHINQTADGASMAQWLVNTLKGKGNVVMIGGVPGTSVDTERIQGAQSVFKKYPGIHVVANVVGEWNQAVAKTKMAEVLASHSNVNGIWVENGCYGAEQGVLEAHHAPIACSGNSSNGHRLMMLPKSQGGIGLQSDSVGVGVNEGAVAFVHAVQVLEGKKIAHTLINPVTSMSVTTATVKLGVNVYPSKTVDPGFMDDIQNAQIPKAADTLHAALTGNP